MVVLRGSGVRLRVKSVWMIRGMIVVRTRGVRTVGVYVFGRLLRGSFTPTTPRARLGGRLSELV